jgi:hypothetical protein
MRQITIFILTFLWTIFMSCSSSPSTQQEPVAKIDDKLSYNEQDYDLMRNYFSSDSLFLATLNKELIAGDTNAIKVKMLLTTPYNARHQTRLTDAEIEIMIEAFYSSSEVVEKFKDIDSSLPNTSADEIRRSTDSIIHRMDELKNSLKENSYDTTQKQ